MAKQRIHGVWIRPGSVEYTSLEPSPDGWTEQGTTVLPLARTEEDPDSEPEWLLSRLRPEAENLAGECAVALPMGKAVARVVDLPTTEPEEIDSMVALQIDKFSPFPVDQLQVTSETLSRTQNATRVLILAMPRDRVEDIGQVFRELDRYPRWVDIDLLGWWWLIRRHHALPESGQDVLFIVNGDDTFLIVAADGVPILFRALGSEDGMSRDDFCRMVVEEATYSVTSLEAEWGTTPDETRVAVWHAGDEPADLVDAMRRDWEVDVVAHSLDSLGSLSAGLAWRAANRDEDMANLAPPAWELAEQARRTRRTFLVGTGAMLGCWAIVLGVFLGALGFQKARLARLNDRLEELAGPVAAVREMREKTEFLERYMDSSFSALETLRAVSVALPPGVDLSQLSYSKGGTINMRGTARTRDPIYEFIKGLERSDLYSEVKLDKVDTVKAQNVFRVTAESGGEKI